MIARDVNRTRPSASNTPDGSGLFATARAWELTGALSPRRSVRVADQDVSGEVVNTYTGTCRTSAAEAPDVPWAIYLAGSRDGRYRLIAFDLDAKGGRALVAADTATITDLLDRANVPHVVCASGPSGGRHVWVALVDDIDAATVATLGRLVRRLCPSLDLAPLLNPVTGCVRPPGSPHRHGGTSTVIAGDVANLTRPAATGAQVHELVATLAAQLHDDDGATAALTHSPAPLDALGHPYLPGPKRRLPAGSAAALESDAASGDASAVLWRILCGAASAKWHYEDVAALIDSPGMAHVRSYRAKSGRRLRPARGADSPARVLSRQWAKAVDAMAIAPRRPDHTDATFDQRAADIAVIATHVQTRADSSPGRWTQGGGPTDRLVLDALCALALDAVAAAVEADIRRLALTCGIGRETARTALLRLAADQWIARVASASGTASASWTIDPRSAVHRRLNEARSQADPRPALGGDALRSSLLNQLRDRLALCRHDAFATPLGLGSLCGYVYARSIADPSALVGPDQELPDDAVCRAVERLVAEGLVKHAAEGWRAAPAARRDAVARRRGSAGALVARGELYALERAVWEWWRAEYAWMTTPSHVIARRRPTSGQLTLIAGRGRGALPPHPRGPDGRADYRAARRALAGSPAAALTLLAA